MKEYKKAKNYNLYQGNMLDMLTFIKPNSIDSIITDPPYELNFMGKGWDNSGIAFQKQTWQKCFEVLKPGGYLLAFGGTRTFHRIACAIEDAGFEIRDTIMWLYGSGFPKSLNIGLAIDKKRGVESEVVGVGKSGSTAKAFNLNEQQREAGTGILAGEYEIKKANNEWNGWGTALKPAYEPIIVARKPFKGSLVDNVLKNSVGGINIDECRVGEETISTHNAPKGTFAGGEAGRGSDTNSYKNHVGRFPANVILTYDENDKEEVCGNFPNSKGMSSQNNYSNGHIYRGQSFQESKTSLNGFREWYNDEGSASRYFYCAKASKKDRDSGEIKNTHPTVKPCDLMQYLVRLVSPKGATILDPFMGSGSTGKAVMYENNERNANYKFIGIETTEEYLPIAQARIECAVKQKQLTLFDM